MKCTHGKYLHLCPLCRGEDSLRAETSAEETSPIPLPASIIKRTLTRAFRCPLLGMALAFIIVLMACLVMVSRIGGHRAVVPEAISQYEKPQVPMGPEDMSWTPSEPVKVEEGVVVSPSSVSGFQALQEPIKSVFWKPEGLFLVTDHGGFSRSHRLQIDEGLRFSLKEVRDFGEDDGVLSVWAEHSHHALAQRQWVVGNFTYVQNGPLMVRYNRDGNVAVKVGEKWKKVEGASPKPLLSGNYFLTRTGIDFQWMVYDYRGNLITTSKKEGVESFEIAPISNLNLLAAVKDGRLVVGKISQGGIKFIPVQF